MKLTRRRFLQTAALSTAAAAVGLTLPNFGLGPLTMRNVDAAEVAEPWRLRVTNLEGSTVGYTFDQLEALPATTVSAELNCDDALVAEGTWSGVSLAFLLQGSGLNPGIASVRLNAKDGYTVSIPFSEAMDPNVIIAYELNGWAIAETIRLVVPGLSGDMWIDSIDSITMVGAAPSTDQVGSDSSNLAGVPAPQQAPDQSQLQAISQVAGTSTEAVVPPAIAVQATQRATSEQEPGIYGRGLSAAFEYGMASVAAVLLIALGYAARKLRHSN